MSSSAARALANQANAKLSTGPTTAEGKAIASQNSTKHGLTSAKVVVPGESQEEFDKYREDMLESLNPQSVFEDELADRVVAAYWRLQRFFRLENAFFDERITAIQQETGIGSPSAAGAMLFTDPEQMKRMSLLMRYMKATQRECDKSMAELQKEQKRRQQAEFEQAALEQMVDNAKKASVGSVSQTKPAPTQPATTAQPAAAAAATMSPALALRL
jgi:hypothetical protein